MENSHGDNVVVIVGGGHMGQKMYNHIKGKCEVVMVDAPRSGGIHTRWWKMLEGLAIHGGTTKIYVATPEREHDHWLEYVQPLSDVLVEKPFLFPGQDIGKIFTRLNNNQSRFTCNLPWRLFFNCTPDPSKVHNPSINWIRPTSFMYRELSVPIGLDIGVHMVDILGGIMGRRQNHFDVIMINTMTEFSAMYMGIPIHLKFVDTLQGLCHIFGAHYDPVLPEQKIIDNFELWLSGEWNKMAKPDELEWLHKMMYHQMRDYETRVGGKPLA